MKSARVAGAKGLIEATIDGLSFSRTEASAAAHMVPRQYQVEWDRVAAVDFVEPTKGKAAIRVTLVGDATGGDLDSKPDPYVMKVRRKRRPEAREFVRLVNEEITHRRRWIRTPPGQDTTRR